MSKKLSKVQQAKGDQGYIDKPVHPMCMNCQHYTSDQRLASEWMGTKYYAEKNRRCAIGGFAVKKQATCSQHEFTW